jgi:hypothetical protein
MHLWPDIDRAGCRDFRVGFTSAEPALSAMRDIALAPSIAECHLLQPVNTQLLLLCDRLGDYTHKLPSRLGHPTNRFPWVYETRCAERRTEGNLVENSPVVQSFASKTI